MNDNRTLYTPALRLKTGELNGISQVSEDIKKYIRPHFIIPPSKERDTSNLELFGDLEIQSYAGTTLARFWHGRSVLLNPKYIYKEFGAENSASWLPALFDRTRHAGVEAIPVATISDLESNRFEGIKSSINFNARVKVAIVIKADDLVSKDLKTSLNKQLSRLNVEPDECCLLLDFGGAHFGNPENTALIIESSYDEVQSLGTWETITFQGTSYPEVNPADPKSKVLVPRNEWIAWKIAMSLSPRTPDTFVFGDFAADSSKMHFGKGGAPAIRHYRYATPEHWLVVRADETGKDKERMKWVAKQIIESGYFSGRDFSLADDYIYRTAKENGGPGASAIWRQINIAHHLTRVVVDNAQLRGITIEEPTKIIQTSEQMELSGI